MIYWVQAGDTGLVKVGFALDVLGRLRELQTGCPAPLTLLREEPGGRRLEAALHALYGAKRQRGEWFALSAGDVAVDLPVVAEPPEAAYPRPPAPVLPEVAAVIAAVGDGAKLAKLCGVTRFAVQQWKARGIPPRQVVMISKLTGISPHELRPDVWGPQPVGV